MHKMMIFWMVLLLVLIAGPSLSTKSEKIAVIGGGPSGLISAHRLAEKGYDVTVFERASRVGGKTRTFTVDGRPYDMTTIWVPKGSVKGVGIDSCLNRLIKITASELMDGELPFSANGTHASKIFNLFQNAPVDALVDKLVREYSFYACALEKECPYDNVNPARFALGLSVFIPLTFCFLRFVKKEKGLRGEIIRGASIAIIYFWVHLTFYVYDSYFKELPIITQQVIFGVIFAVYGIIGLAFGCLKLYAMRANTSELSKTVDTLECKTNEDPLQSSTNMKMEDVVPGDDQDQDVSPNDLEKAGEYAITLQ